MDRKIAAVCTLAVFGWIAFACADNDVLPIGAGGLRDANGPILAAPPDAADAETSTTTGTAMCVATDCPYPFATCQGPNGLPRYRCGTDLRSDPANCGACGQACGQAASELNVVATCVDGECRAVCWQKYLDCNGIVDDGCETNPTNDPMNCGACGVTCAPGEKCRDGKCGCPPGTIECSGSCRDLAFDKDNCGACGHRCPPPVDGGEPPPHTVYDCVERACGVLRCDRTRGFWADCNGTLTDGCEIDLAAKDANGHFDRNNCGECGRKCAPGAVCLRTSTNGIDCVECPPGLTLCGDTCIDLDNDPLNCGACAYSCRTPLTGAANAANGTTVCDRGGCSYACKPGFADCNAMIEDGCEVELAKDPRHCGACGVSCDNTVGQPCVNGQCATKECDAGGPVQ